MKNDSAVNRKVCHVIGNWKMQGSRQHVTDFFNELAKTKEIAWSEIHAVICPPYPYLTETAELMQSCQRMFLGAQNVSEFENGAYTGQVSARMLLDSCCRYVIVGHSECRQYGHETDLIIAKKFLLAKRVGLIPILCVGETLAQREQNQIESVILSQLKGLLSEGIAVFSDAIIAYEPVWAIGTGKTASPEQAQAVHHLIRTTLAEYDSTLADRIPILYGGSVKPSNAEALFVMQDIDGALVGGASLSASDFIALCKVGAKCTELS